MSAPVNDDDSSAFAQVDAAFCALEAENAILKEQLRAARTRRGVAERVSNSAGAVLDDVIETLREARLIRAHDTIAIVPTAVRVLVEELLADKATMRDLCRQLCVSVNETAGEAKRADSAAVEVARLAQLTDAYASLLDDAQGDARQWRHELVRARRGVG